MYALVYGIPDDVIDSASRLEINVYQSQCFNFKRLRIDFYAISAKISQQRSIISGSEIKPSFQLMHRESDNNNTYRYRHKFHKVSSFSRRFRSRAQIKFKIARWRKFHSLRAHNYSRTSHRQSSRILFNDQFVISEFAWETRLNRLTFNRLCLGAPGSLDMTRN